MCDSLLLCLVELLKGDDPRLLRQCMGCLSNLTERHECHPFIRRHQIHNVVLEHFHNADAGLAREAARFLTNITAVHENHPPVVSGGGVQAFLTGAAKQDAITTRFSTLGLLNLSTLAENHHELLGAKCHDLLIDLAAGAARTWTALDSLGDPIEEEPHSPRSKADAAFIAGTTTIYYIL
ncbi:hypothetical protein B484DRAFT_390551 [Ochromonadaceae sp. CCMP2298]|nr:hypothetical protein B484DRAFT_390551 [Ochromonadaceae sp. CCMP2298]